MNEGKLPNKKYLTLDEIANFYGLQPNNLDFLVKDRTIKTVYSSKKQTLLVPRKSFMEAKDYLDHILSKMDVEVKDERTIFDHARQTLIGIILTLIIPLISYSLFIKIAGWDFAFSFTGGFVGVGLLLASVILFYFLYSLLFEKYSSDLPPLVDS